MDIEKLTEIARQHDIEIREFRLSGNLTYLLGLIEDVISASQEINVSIFFANVTSNEKLAFEAIKTEIGNEGNISVVKMMQKTGLSRPVFTSLLQKMEKYGVAQIKNQGVKGTYIKIMEELINDN